MPDSVLSSVAKPKTCSLHSPWIHCRFTRIAADLSVAGCVSVISPIEFGSCTIVADALKQMH